MVRLHMDTPEFCERDSDPHIMAEILNLLLVPITRGRVGEGVLSSKDGDHNIFHHSTFYPPHCTSGRGTSPQ